MKIARIPSREPEREEIRSFFGLNRQSLPGVGESADEENVSTELYPFLSPRRDAVLLTNEFGACRALVMKDQIAWVTDIGESDFCRLYYAGHETPVVMPAGDKRLVSMGTKIIIFPDALWYDTASGESGNLGASFTSTDGVSVSVTLCRLDGGEYEYDSSSVAPDDPADGALWCDTSTTPAALMKYSKTSAMWVAVDSTYVKISTPGIGASFKEDDGVEISSCAVPSLNADVVIAAAGDDYIVVPGIISTPVTQTTPITVARKIPLVDFAVEYSNRIWACRSGLDASGNLVNEIYASKLGDPTNWNCFSGLVSDSYAASVGSDGPFTGAAVFLGYVMFFKERCVHKVFGNRPSNFQIVTSNISGVAEGADRSLAVLDDTLYFAGVDGLVAYDGTVPQKVSYPLGEIASSGAICAVRGSTLYVSALYKGVREFYTYDGTKAVWHRYSPLAVSAMAPSSCGLIVSAGDSLYVIDSKDSGAGASALTGFSNPAPEAHDWYFETGVLTAERDDLFISKIEAAAAVDAGSELTVRLIGDEDDGYPVVTVRPSVRRTFTIPLATARHRRWRLRISGRGRAVVYHVTKFTEKG